MTLNIEGWKSDNPEVNDFEIAQVEKALGVKFPKSYISLMKKWNGGYLIDEHQLFIDGDIPENLKYYLGDGFWIIGSIAGISSKVDERRGILYTAKTAHEWGIPDKIIAFDGDGHTWLGFDYRNDINAPEIIFIESDELLSFVVAKDFSAFISSLVPTEVNNP